MAKRKTRQRRGDTMLPIGYLSVAVALAILILPSALRPPQDQQNASASFSPDAPPDDTPPESLLQSIRKAQSSTAGRTTAPAAEEVVIEETPPPPVKRRAVRAGCFGDPPRQTESVYSHLCVPAFTGSDNGGATTKGVTKDLVVVGISIGASSASGEGFLGRDFAVEDTALEHDLKVWQTYFNDRFEFYGRYLQICLFKMNTDTDDNQRTGIANARTVCNGDPFIIINPGDASVAIDETIRRKIVDFGTDNFPLSFYRERHPYAFSFTMDSWKQRRLTAEAICKQFPPDKPLSYQNLNERDDATFNYNAPRKWGLIIYQDSGRTGGKDFYQAELDKCGIKIEAHGEYNLEDNAQTIGEQAAKMKAANITSIIMAGDILSAGLISQTAERLQYYPEWFHNGGGGLCGDMELYTDNQAQHFAGICYSEIMRPDPDKDWYRAYKEIDPEGEPTSAYFRDLQQISGGIQHAGGLAKGTKSWILTPETFWQGLKGQPRRAPEPRWSIGGGYGEDDYTYQDYISLIWWKQSVNLQCHLDGGQRYTTGEIPTRPLAWMDPNGGCITEAEKGVQG